MRKVMIAAVVGAFLTVATGVPQASLADTDKIDKPELDVGIPIMVLGEDSDRQSIKRSSDIYRRVLLQLQDQMNRYDFKVIDEHMVAAHLKWDIQDRRPKEQLMKLAKKANASGDPRVYSRAMVTFKIRANSNDIGFARKANVRIAGELYDTQSNTYLGSWETPRMTFPVPKDCRGHCIEEVVGDHARDIAASLGDVLRKKLDYLVRQNEEELVMSTGSGNSGLETTYSFTFRNLNTREIFAVTDVMEHEFPNFVRSMSPNGDTTVMKYGYVSRAKGGDIYEWMNILLADQGLDPDTVVKVTVYGTSIDIEKINPGR